ncbi:MAG: hypothetical protein R2857_15835 [Vampirovibrionales bacterium]
MTGVRSTVPGMTMPLAHISQVPLQPGAMPVLTAETETHSYYTIQNPTDQQSLWHRQQANQMQQGYTGSVVDGLRGQSRILGMFRNPLADPDLAPGSTVLQSSTGVLIRTMAGRTGELFSTGASELSRNPGGFWNRMANVPMLDQRLGFNARPGSWLGGFNLAENATRVGNLHGGWSVGGVISGEFKNHCQGLIRYMDTGAMRHLPSAIIGVANTALAVACAGMAFSRQYSVSMQKGDSTGAFGSALTAGGMELAKFAGGYAVGSIAYGAVGALGVGAIAGIPVLPLLAAGFAGVMFAKLFTSVFGPSVESLPHYEAPPVTYKIQKPGARASHGSGEGDSMFAQLTNPEFYQQGFSDAFTESANPTLITPVQSY